MDNMSDFLKEEKVCALYIRVSTDDQMELSPDAQLRLLREYAKKNNYAVSNEFTYVDAGISGRKADKRPAFMEMISHAKSKEHPFDIILVWKFSRFARNQEESIVYKSLLKKSKVDVISVSEPLPDGMIGTLVERIFEWMDEYYSIRLSGEVKRGMTENALRGAYQTLPPIGYDYVGYKQAPVINNAQKIIVQKVFEMFNTGSSFSQIARILNSEGFHTNRNGKFENRTIKYILQNPFYIGKVRWNYYNRSECKYNEKEKIIISDGLHEAIVDDETWNKTQERLQTVIKPYAKRDSVYNAHWLVGTLKCHACESSLSYSKPLPQKHVKARFRCQKSVKGACAFSNSLTVEYATECVIKGLESVIKTKKIPNLTVHNTTDDSSENLAQSITEALKKIETKEKRIKESYINEIDTLEEYKENKISLHKERQRLEEMLENITASSKTKSNKEPQKIILNNIGQVVEILKSDEHDKEKKANAIRSICSKIVYEKASNIFTFYFYVNI